MPPQDQPFAIPPSRIDDIFELITKLARGGKEGSYRVYPPQIVIDEPAVLSADDVVERLRDTTWNVRFYDGHIERFSFVELVTFRHLIGDMKLAMAKAGFEARSKQATFQQPATIDRRLHIPSVMAPASVKRLLKEMPLQTTSAPG